MEQLLIHLFIKSVPHACRFQTLLSPNQIGLVADTPKVELGNLQEGLLRTYRAREA